MYYFISTKLEELEDLMKIGMYDAAARWCLEKNKQKIMWSEETATEVETKTFTENWVGKKNFFDFQDRKLKLSVSV